MTPIGLLIRFYLPLVLIHPLMIAVAIPFWMRSAQNRAEWWLHTASAVLLSIFLFLFYPWSMAGYPFRILWPFLLSAILIRSYTRHARRLPRQTGRRWWSWMLPAASNALLASLASFTAAEIAPPRLSSIELAFPLRSGVYTALNGGSGPLLNGHDSLPWEHVARPVEGAILALDIVRLNAAGLSAGFPRDRLDSYSIYGDPVYSPCTGTIRAARTYLPDLIPPYVDIHNPDGNYVLLDCGGVDVLLAHLKQFSVVVAAGMRVTAGDPVGRVGNSGNTSEPHLHIHASRNAHAEAAWLDGDPVAILFGGRFLSRNDLVWIR